ncbi:winged helix-turn-helix domain-containing protein [Halorubellus salinus]|uniref:winged helix-turn-helix domain-containing protein n=1 Tax=Halorubellus salinus TaxID=755309 RepID=UPI001D06A7FC|nr:helix-turn-helix domain-containing protein [Halorubellus salinus]
MNERTSDGFAVERRSPEETFALLGDDTRIGILRALGETPEDARSFSDLRERVGTEDSGRFNYHLRKLVGSFVRKTDDGYELTYAGRQIVGAMYAGTYTANASVDAIAVPGECPVCDGALEAAYAEETATLSCSECEEWFNEFSFPPGSLDQFDADELPMAFDRWMSHVVDGVLDGFCHICAGRTTGRLVLDDDDRPFATYPAHVEFTCGRCGGAVRTAPVTPVFMHPATRGFLFDHGFDVSELPSWVVWSALDLPAVEVVSREPVRVEVTVAAGDERLVATVDADASVDDVHRTSG